GGEGHLVELPAGLVRIVVYRVAGERCGDVQDGDAGAEIVMHVAREPGAVSFQSGLEGEFAQPPPVAPVALADHRDGDEGNDAGRGGGPEPSPLPEMGTHDDPGG